VTIDVSGLPTVNATLNGCAAVFLGLGWIAIRAKKAVLHRKLMTAALAASTVFLACYVVYHVNSQVVTRYAGPPQYKNLYYFILLTHIPLAVVVVPAALAAVWQAVKGNLEKHRKITRWLWPVWMYVSVTGVLIYVMLYHLAA
jgi:putative membrane protein